MNQEYGQRDFSIIDPNGYRLGLWATAASAGEPPG